MDTTQKGGDTTTCPYDKSHVIQKSRLLWHIQKCKAAQTNSKYYGHCKYNYLHIIEKTYLSNHEDCECPNRPKILTKEEDTGDSAIRDEAFSKWRNQQNLEKKNKNKNDNKEIKEMEVEQDYEIYHREQNRSYQANANEKSVVEDIDNDNDNETSRIQQSWLQKNDRPKHSNENKLKVPDIKKLFSLKDDSDQQHDTSKDEDDDENQNKDEGEDHDDEQDAQDNQSQSHNYVMKQSESKDQDASFQSKSSEDNNHKSNTEQRQLSDEELSYQKKPTNKQWNNIAQNKDSLSGLSSSDSDEDSDEDKEEKKEEEKRDNYDGNQGIYLRNVNQSNCDNSNLVENSLDASLQYENHKTHRIIKSSNRNYIENNFIKSEDTHNNNKKTQNSSGSNKSNPCDMKPNQDNNKEEEQKEIGNSKQDQTNNSMNNDEFCQSYIGCQNKQKYTHRYIKLHNLPEDQRENIDLLQADIDSAKDYNNNPYQQSMRGNRNASDSNATYNSRPQGKRQNYNQRKKQFVQEGRQNNRTIQNQQQINRVEEDFNSILSENNNNYNNNNKNYGNNRNGNVRGNRNNS